MLDKLRPFMDKQMTTIGGEILKGDHTFKFIKKIAKMGNTSIFGALYTICNEYEEIRMQLLVPSKSQWHLWSPFQEMMKTYEQYGFKPPRLFFTDNVRGDRNLLHGTIKSLNNNSTDNSTTNQQATANNMSIKMPDKVIPYYIRTPSKSDGLIKSMILPNCTTRTIVIGLDCEWNYSVGSSPRKVAIIQIAYKVILACICITHIYIIMIC